jgi:hypothetical protein
MKRAEWDKHVARWKRSGETTEEYGRPRRDRGQEVAVVELVPADAAEGREVRQGNAPRWSCCR